MQRGFPSERICRKHAAPITAAACLLLRELGLLACTASYSGIQVAVGHASFCFACLRVGQHLARRVSGGVECKEPGRCWSKQLCCVLQSELSGLHRNQLLPSGSCAEKVLQRAALSGSRPGQICQGWTKSIGLVFQLGWDDRTLACGPEPAEQQFRSVGVCSGTESCAMALFTRLLLCFSTVACFRR